MSLNIVDSLLDKLSFVSKDRNIPLGKKFTGTQNFFGTNSYGLSQSIPSEFTRAFMDPEYLTQAHNRMNRSSSLDSKMNYFHYFEPSNDRLVSRVSKLLSPMLTSQDCFHVVPSLDIFQDQEFLNRGVKVFYEEIEQHIDMLSKMLIPNVKSLENTSQVPLFNAENPSSQGKESNSDSKSDLCHSPNRSCVESLSNQTNLVNSQINLDQSTCYQPKSSAEIPSNYHKGSNFQLKSDMDTCQTNLSSGVKSPSINIMQKNTHAPLAAVVLLENKKPLRNNNQTMNKELTNRKNKELQKRSKKRRRRQKKANVVLDKDCVTKAAKTLKDESKVQANGPENKTSDILCDITLTDDASSVQILLPSSPSFVISIESAEDDSDWDSSSDCEWLTDCSEFELSGIFISNLSTPLTSTFSNTCFSHPSVPPSHAEEVEMRHLGAALRRVNKDWIDSTKGLDTKPKVATKVSFAPDDELVEVLHVDIYERKGEWETYATERMRFKRRINELEKIIAPCLSKEHRDKIFLKLHDDSNL